MLIWLNCWILTYNKKKKITFINLTEVKFWQSFSFLLIDFWILINLINFIIWIKCLKLFDFHKHNSYWKATTVTWISSFLDLTLKSVSFVNLAGQAFDLKYDFVSIRESEHWLDMRIVNFICYYCSNVIIFFIFLAEISFRKRVNDHEL